MLQAGFLVRELVVMIAHREMAKGFKQFVIHQFIRDARVVFDDGLFIGRRIVVDVRFVLSQFLQCDSQVARVRFG